MLSQEALPPVLNREILQSEEPSQEIALYSNIRIYWDFHLIELSIKSIQITKWYIYCKLVNYKYFVPKTPVLYVLSYLKFSFIQTKVRKKNQLNGVVTWPEDTVFKPVLCRREREMFATFWIVCSNITLQRKSIYRSQ